MVIEKLTDVAGSLLLPEDRVMDVLDNRDHVRAFVQALKRGGGDNKVSKYTTAPEIKPRKRKVEVPDYVRDDVKFDYVVPAAEELMKPGRNPGVIKYTCVVCAKGFVQLQHLNFHIRAHTGDERVTKAIEAAEAGQRTEFAAVASKERRFFCCYPTCENNPDHNPGAHPFKDFGNCRQHYLRRHTLEKPYSCDKCGRGYAVKADMQTHQKHCGVRYACLCGVKFGEKRRLALHLSEHPNDSTHGEVFADLELRNGSLDPGSSHAPPPPNV